MSTILPFDEINALIREDYSSVANLDINEQTRRITDKLLDILIFAYTVGISETRKALEVDVEDEIDEMYEIIWSRIGGETFEDRVRTHVENHDAGRLAVLAESEAHRVCETAGYRGARRASEEFGITVGKRWETMLDDRVRDTHRYLQSDVVPLGQEFYTYDGDHAQFPGGFQNASENVGCRCHVEYTTMNTAGSVPVSIGQGSP